MSLPMKLPYWDRRRQTPPGRLDFTRIALDRVIYGPDRAYKLPLSCGLAFELLLVGWISPSIAQCFLMYLREHYARPSYGRVAHL
jgi:hypothetical protein